jgi:4-hydroxy-4-methyl-2-oxoglutarate aldolase
MARVLTPDQLEALRKIDTATMTNAIDHLNVRPPTAGFASLELQCLMPELPPMVGYAVTATGDSSSPAIPGRKSQDRALYEAIRDSPKPAIVVFQNIGTDRIRSNQFGDIMVTTFNRMGAVGAVTDGGIRDLAGMRRRAPGFQMFAAGAVPSAGVSIVVEVGITVSICGLTIRPGELLHGDANGLITVPDDIADEVAAEGERVLEKEQKKVEFIMSDEFSLERLAEISGW